MSGTTMLCFVCMLVMLHWVQAINRDNFDSDSYQDLAAGYLTKFGYMTQKTSVKSSSLQSLDRAISKFQEFSGLEPTGRLNAETVEYMQKPRCGVKDIIEEDEDTPR